MTFKEACDEIAQINLDLLQKAAAIAETEGISPTEAGRRAADAVVGAVRAALEKMP